MRMMPFSPGATCFAKVNRRSRCLWREEPFLLPLIRVAVNPILGLRTCVEDWHWISIELREAPRCRTLQIERLEAEQGILS